MFFGVLSFHKGFKASETGAPEVAILLEPGIDGSKRLGIELVDAVATLAMLMHEMSAAEKAQVLGDCRPGNGKGVSDISSGLVAAAQKIEDGTAGGIGEGLEGCLGVPGERICNRTVTHNA